MTKKGETTKNDADDNQMSDRRKLLRSLAASGGVFGTGALSPDQWTRPIVDATLVPVHATTTGEVECDLTASLNWATSQDNDLNLEIDTPRGTTISPSNLVGEHLQHEGGQGPQTGSSFQSEPQFGEVIRDIAGKLTTANGGIYSVYAVFDNLDRTDGPTFTRPVDFSIRIRICDNEETFNRDTTLYDGERILLATVNANDGSIIEPI